MRKSLPILLIFSGLLAAADFPQAEILSKELHAKIYLPDAKSGFYHATRFDWAGMIESVTYQGHVFYGQWFKRVDPNIRDFVIDGSDVVASPCTAAVGPAEEFNTDKGLPLGFAEAPVGGTFLKIGVGVLRKKDDTPYNRFGLYDVVDPGQRQMTKKANSIEFTQTVSDASSGYGYTYTKAVVLADGKPEMTLQHRLKNTGSKPIDTNVYNHNFTRVDGEGPGPDYSVIVPHEIQSQRPPAADAAALQGNKFVYLKPVDINDRVSSSLGGFQSGQGAYDFRIENAKAGVGERVTGNRPLLSESLWSIHTVVAVEPFIHISIAPGEEFTWDVTYSYYKILGGTK